MNSIGDGNGLESEVIGVASSRRMREIHTKAMMIHCIPFTPRYSASRSKPLIVLPCSGTYGKLGMIHDVTANRKREAVVSCASGKVRNGIGF